MPCRRELLAFLAVLAALVAVFLHDALFGGKVLSPADVLFASASFATGEASAYEPANRLLIDPVLQFQPWLEFNRSMIRRGRLPLWNSFAGCGAPHLANGQSAVFDPFHVLAYIGTLPEAYAWMAAARLWVAGLGMFLLAQSWGLGPWGRWFCGLAFPFCGFLVVWLLYPVANVAVWMPWVFWSSERLLQRPAPRSVGCLALFVGFALFGGHIQTCAHVLLAAGVYVAWRVGKSRADLYAPGMCALVARRALPAWGLGMLLGLALGAIAYIPLGFYLSRSPVWSDRAGQRLPWWQFAKPRPLDAVCTALPYAFGSQRRGHPNLARALGVHNLNESAGGFAGLATLLWLAPLAWSARRSRPQVWFLTGLVACGALGAFRIPPVDNLLRALPVLNVTDNRRLTLWVAFGLVALGGIGLDHLSAALNGQAWRRWTFAWVVAAMGLSGAAASVGFAEPWLRARASDHYARAAAESAVVDSAVYHDRADRQVHLTLSFLPRYLAQSAGQLVALAVLAALLRRARVGLSWARVGLIGMTIVDLFSFGFGLNPAIAPADGRPVSQVIAYLRSEIGSSARALGLGAELPPNTLMRYGLADPRNYDSVELERSLAWFAPLYEPGRRPERTSRREMTWGGVIQSQDRLCAAGVGAVVAATPPPSGAFERVDRVGDVWVARLRNRPLVGTATGQGRTSVSYDHGVIQIEFQSNLDDRVLVAETYDPGWGAVVDGHAAVVEPHLGTFLSLPIAAGTHSLTLRYDPPEVRLALVISGAALVATLLALMVPHQIRSKNRTIGLDELDRSGYNRRRDLHRTSQPAYH